MSDGAPHVRGIAAVLSVQCLMATFDFTLGYYTVPLKRPVSRTEGQARNSHQAVRKHQFFLGLKSQGGPMSTGVTPQAQVASS